MYSREYRYKGEDVVVCLYCGAIIEKVTEEHLTYDDIYYPKCSCVNSKEEVRILHEKYKLDEEMRVLKGHRSTEADKSLFDIRFALLDWEYRDRNKK